MDKLTSEVVRDLILNARMKDLTKIGELVEELRVIKIQVGLDKPNLAEILKAADKINTIINVIADSSLGPLQGFQELTPKEIAKLDLTF